ncbi:MAG: hypothetical protein RI907_1087 [Pseudomonadota bacterium]|jgi:hypothetical protein
MGHSLTFRACLGRLCVAWLAVACWATPVWAGDNWEALRRGRDREDVSTWVRPVDGMAVKAFRGVTDVHVNAWAVLALLADTPNLSNWVFLGKASRHPDGTPPEQAYLRFKGVWPADDRDVLIRTTVAQLPDQAIVVESRDVAGWPRQEGCVRIASLKNTFKLVPLPQGWTRVEFETLVDLGGLVPAWMANFVSTNAPLDTLKALQTQVRKPAYQVKSPADLPQHYHSGGLFTLPEAHLNAERP